MSSRPSTAPQPPGEPTRTSEATTAPEPQEEAEASPPEPRVHPTAVVHPAASLARGVVVEAYAVVGEGVELGEGTWVGSHALVQGPARVGPGCQIHGFASVGSPPQIKGPVCHHTWLVLGRESIVREFVTLNRGTPDGGGETRIEDGCLLMAYSHVAHDCLVGQGAVLANGATLAGHVEVGEGAVLGGLCAIQQFARVGRLAFLAGGALVDRDVPPFTRAAGDRARLSGLNTVGLKRAGLPPETLRALKEAYRALFRSNQVVAQTSSRLRQSLGHVPEVVQLLDFIAASTRGICR